VALVTVALVALAGSFTWDTNATQDRCIHKMLELENTKRASKGQSQITTEQFVNGMTTRLWTQQWRKVRRRLLRKADESVLNDVVVTTP
jgi:hypothetical protein